MLDDRDCRAVNFSMVYFEIYTSSGAFSFTSGLNDSIRSCISAVTNSSSHPAS